MAVSSTTGTSSGTVIDVRTIVSQLMTIERQPLAKLDTELSGIESKISTWGKVQSALSALQDAGKSLYQSGSWGATTAASSDDAVVKASGGSAAQGSYRIDVQSLARSQSVVSRGFAGADAVVGGGTLTIQLGRLSQDGASFAADPERAAVSLTLPAGATLADVRNAINGADAGVSASIINDGSGQRLVLTAKTTGLDQAFEISVADADGNDTDDAGLSAFAMPATAASAGNGMRRTQAAGDARLMINGLEVTSGTNRVADAIEGVTLDLKKVTAETVTVDVGADTTKYGERVDAFVTAYNALNALMTSLTKYDGATKTAGALQGNSTATRIQQQLRELVRGNLGDSKTTGLTAAGFAIGRDGSLSIGADARTALLADPDGLKALFAGTTVGGETTGGVARRLGAALDGLLGAGGTLATTTETLQSRKTDIRDRQTRMEDRLGEIQTRLTQQYSSLDANLAKLQNSFSSIQTMLNSLGNS